MKKIAFLVIGIILSGIVQAQVSGGFRGGINLSDFEAGPPPEGLRMPLLPSPTFGGLLNFRTGKHFSIQSEINFAPLGRQFRAVEGGMREATRINYLKGNLLAKFSVGTEILRFYADAGPYAGYALWGRTSWDYGDMEPLDEGRRDIDFEEDNLYRYDYGLLVGMGMQHALGQGYVFLEGRVGHGFADLRRRNDNGTRQWLNRFINFSTGYIFRFSN